MINSSDISQALKIVKNPNILVNMVSQRVRQLGQGHKALIAVDPRMSYMDVALREIAEGRLEFDMGQVPDLERIRTPKSRKKR